MLEFSGVHAGAPYDRMEIFGDHGMLRYDFGSDTIRSAKPSVAELQNVDLPVELTSEWRVEDDFINAVKSKGRVRPHPDFEDGVRYMRVVQAVADSRARNEWVEVKK